MEQFKKIICSATLNVEGTNFSIQFPDSVPQSIFVEAIHHNCDGDSVEIQLQQLYGNTPHERNKIEYQRIELNQSFNLEKIDNDNNPINEVRLRVCKCRPNEPGEDWSVVVTAILS